MDAYLDLSYICHIITLLNIPYYFKKILNYKIRKGEFIVLLLLSILMYFNIFIFANYPYLNLLFLFVYFFIFHVKQVIKYYLAYIFIYYANISTCLIFTRDLYLYHSLIFVSNEKAVFYILFQFINILIENGVINS